MATMREALDGIWDEANGARVEAADSYDKLLAELAKEEPAADKVTAHAGSVYVNSTKFFAGLMLAPLSIAGAIQNSAAPEGE